MKTSRKAYVVVVSSSLDNSQPQRGIVKQVYVFTKRHPAEMCHRQFTAERCNGRASLFVRYMNDGRVDLSGC